MSVRPWLAGVAVLVAVALAPVGAHAQDDEGGPGFLSRLRYNAAGGMMAGVGPQGRELWRGPYASFNVHGESTIGMELGVEVAYAESEDILRTKFLSFGGILRLSPMPEDYRAYVQLGAVLSRVSFDPKQAGLETPGNRTRPGGSFGVGVDVIETDNLAVGGLLTYNGVVLASGSSRSYMVASLNLTFKPSPY